MLIPLSSSSWLFPVRMGSSCCLPPCCPFPRDWVSERCSELRHLWRAFCMFAYRGYSYLIVPQCSGRVRLYNMGFHVEFHGRGHWLQNEEPSEASQVALRLATRTTFRTPKHATITFSHLDPRGTLPSIQCWCRSQICDTDNIRSLVNTPNREIEFGKMPLIVHSWANAGSALLNQTQFSGATLPHSGPRSTDPKTLCPPQRLLTLQANPSSSSPNSSRDQMQHQCALSSPSPSP